VALLEAAFEDPAASKGSKGDHDLLARHKREAELLSHTLHAFAEACQLQLLPVACPVPAPAPGSSGMLDGLHCWQDRVAEALAVAEDALCKSGLLGPTAACGVPEGTLPGTGLQAEGWRSWPSGRHAWGSGGGGCATRCPGACPGASRRLGSLGTATGASCMRPRPTRLASLVPRARQGEAVGREDRGGGHGGIGAQSGTCG